MLDKESSQRDLLIEHFRLIDGTGNLPTDNMSVLISGGRIAEIGTQILAHDADRLDASGLTVLPGLIDTHVHITSVPGSIYRHDSETEIRQLRRKHLCAYLACGVTTVLDTGAPLDAAGEIKGLLDSGHPGPRVLWLAPAFTSPNGYLTEGTMSSGMFLSPTASVREVEQRFQEWADFNVVGVKVFLESGFGRNCWPIHSPEIRAVIRNEAIIRRLPIYTHSLNEPDIHIALEMGVSVLAHAGGASGMIDHLKDRSISVISTLSIHDSWRIRYELERLDDPLVQLTVPAVELATAREPEAFKFLLRTFARWIAPNAVDETVSALETAVQNKASIARWKEDVRRLHEANIPLVMGTDSGNWPLMPYEFHGTTTLREIELLGESGLSSIEAIQAATLLPAQMLGLSAEIGTVEVGKQADLTIVQGDPLEDLKTLRDAKWTVKDGIVKSPSEWMMFA